MSEGTYGVLAGPPVAPCILAFNLAVSSLVASSPSFLWRLCGTLTCLALCLSPYLNSGAGDHQSEYSIGCMLLIQAFTAIYLLWLSYPLRDFRYERDAVAPNEMSFLRRWYWALCIMNNPRAVGWTCQVCTGTSLKGVHVITASRFIHRLRTYHPHRANLGGASCADA